MSSRWILLAVGADEARLELLAARRGQRRHQRPIFARDEFLDFELAVADEAQRHRLHAAGGARARELAPQHRREREADEVVERAAGEIGVDQGAVDLARVLHGVEHRLLGDGVEHHPLDRLLLERVLLLQHFEHVPGNRLALAIGVGGEDELVGPLEGAGNVVEPLLGLVVDLPDHAEIVLGVDRAVLGRQVPHMAERGQYLVAGAKIFVDRLGLGRRTRQRRCSCNSNKLEARPGAPAARNWPRLSRRKMGMSTLPVKPRGRDRQRASTHGGGGAGRKVPAGHGSFLEQHK